MTITTALISFFAPLPVNEFEKAFEEIEEDDDINENGEDSELPEKLEEEN